MRVIVHSSADAAAASVADFLARAIRAEPALRIGLPSGRTPLPMYRALAAIAHRRRISFRRVTVFGLDEFLGVSSRDPRSYAAYFRAEVRDRVDVNPRNLHVMNGTTRSPAREARRFERAIDEGGGLDVVVLGIGANGHIGFNEPGAALSSDTHVVRLQPRTRRAHAFSFGSAARVPARALSMGIGTILRARAVILLATGPAKARVIERACRGPITTRLPASLLQLHPNVVVVIDRAAARAII